MQQNNTVIEFSYCGGIFQFSDSSMAVCSEYSCLHTGRINGLHFSEKFRSPFLMLELFVGRALLPRIQTVAASRPVSYNS
jgi:hypothetical protein